MLKNEVIQPSTGPFASPCFISKKEGWVLEVLYWLLNNITVKDKFLIPIIDGLLMNFTGLKSFQSWILEPVITKFEWTPDVHKTAFRTNMDHYEFTVMPFI